MKQFWFFIQEMLASLRIHRTSVLIGVITTAFTIACFGLFFLLYLNVKNLAGSFQDDIQLIVYLTDDVSRQRQADLQRQLKSEEAVASLTFISQSQALEDFHQQFPSESSLLDGMGANPLPASFVLTIAPEFQSADAVFAFAERVQKRSEVEYVHYSREWIESLTVFVRHLEVGAVMIGLILALATVTIIANTIRLSFYARKEEVEILRLIGATSPFIAMPYILEGTLLGAVGGGLSLLLLKGAFEFFRQEIDSSGWFQGMNSIVQFFPIQVSVCLVLAGLFLGFVSSLYSVFGLLRMRL